MATGFTLLEVIITLTLLGFILLIISGAFQLGLSAWEKGESTREDYQKIRTLSQLISGQIKSAVPYKIKAQKAEGDYLAFEGKVNSLKFVSALPIKAKQSEGLVYVVYEFKEGGKEGGRFILYEQKVLNRDFMEDKPKEELGVSLFEGISEVRFEYFREGDPEKNQTEEWVEEWNAKDEKKLPRSIKTVIAYQNGEGKRKEWILTLLAPVSANQLEEARALPAGLGRRTILEGLRDTRVR